MKTIIYTIFVPSIPVFTVQYSFRAASTNMIIMGNNLYYIETLWQAVIHGTTATSNVYRTFRLRLLQQIRYIPNNVNISENAARTLEYAYDDWSIYQLGKKFCNPKNEIDIYPKRGMNYKNLFDKEHKLMHGKNEDGNCQSPFNPLKWGDIFTEGNSCHYT